MPYRFGIAVIFLLVSFGTRAQVISGSVVDSDHQPVFGASVYWMETLKGTTTDEGGHFEIKKPKEGQNLIVQFVGFKSDTVEVGEQTSFHIHLENQGPEDEIVIESEREGTVMSHFSHYQTEQLTDEELKKGACCDLAGCFNTTGSVQATTTNVVTNAKELRVLGLSGVYNQVLLEGIPFLQGLSYTYGISSIPGPLIDNIYVSKGANSVLQGWESISGQINVELKEPDQAKRLFLNAYGNSFLETQLNGYYTVGKNRWTNLTAFHMAQPGLRSDRNKDGFMDFPLTRRYEILNKIKFGKDSDFGWSGWMGVRYTHEDRLGGEMDFRDETDRGGNENYGQEIEINQPELWTQAAYLFNDRMRLHLLTSAQFSHQTNWYGMTSYKAKQGMVNSSIQFELSYDEEGSNLKTGVSYRYLDLRENILFTQNPHNLTYAGQYINTQHVPGVFAENILYFANGTGAWISGARLDWHNQFGFKFTPRTLLKYSITEFTSIRGSVGYGWRVANIFPENTNLLASNRDVVFAEELKPEEAINMGVSILHSIYTDPVNIILSTDFYHTRFLNQIFPDYNTDPQKAILENFTGTSISNSFQADVTLDILGLIDIRSSYNYLDVYRMENGSKEQLPFNPRHRFMSSLSFHPMSKKWAIDANIHWFGVQKLPNTSANPPQYQRPDESDPYTIVNAQFSYNFPQVELYAGCENIFDFRQSQPITASDDPFGPYFDTSSNWGPTRGREFYLGVRFFLDRSFTGGGSHN